MTDKEIVKALRCDGNGRTDYECKQCGYSGNCFTRAPLQTDAIERLTAEVERLTRERDAAVKDIREAALVGFVSPCGACRHVDVLPGQKPCSDCKKGNYFDWRGPEPGGEGSK